MGKFVKNFKNRSMIGSIISGAIGLGSSIAGGIKARNAAKAQQRLINQEKAANNNWYNREYYKDYMEGSNAQNVMRRVRDTMKKQNNSINASAAVNGATPEAVMAAKAANNETIANAAGNIQQGADAYKTQVQAQHDAVNQNLVNQQLGQQQQAAQAGSQLLTQGASLVGSAGSALSDFLSKKK